MVLAAHSFGGCDTTSAVSGFDKGSVLSVFISNLPFLVVLLFYKTIAPPLMQLCRNKFDGCNVQWITQSDTF